VDRDGVTLPELEQYLAKAADLFRGSIDQADFKAYNFPLMVFKQISDGRPGAGARRDGNKGAGDSEIRETTTDTATTVGATPRAGGPPPSGGKPPYPRDTTVSEGLMG
jgi:hypothetical protein